MYVWKEQGDLPAVWYMPTQASPFETFPFNGHFSVLSREKPYLSINGSLAKFMAI